MKRNFLTLLLAGALVFSSSTVSMAADLTDTEQVPTAAEELTAEQENSDQEVIEAEIVEEQIMRLLKQNHLLMQSLKFHINSFPAMMLLLQSVQMMYYCSM